MKPRTLVSCLQSLATLAAAALPAAALLAATVPAFAEPGIQTAAVSGEGGWSPIGFDLWPSRDDAVYGLRLGLCGANRDVCGLSASLLYNDDETASPGLRFGGVNCAFQSRGSLDIALLSNVVFDERVVAGLTRHRVVDTAIDTGIYYGDVVVLSAASALAAVLLYAVPEIHELVVIPVAVASALTVPTLAGKMVNGGRPPSDWGRSGGLQVAALGANYGFCNYYGAQVALWGNYVAGELSGLQISAFRNYCGNACYGAQIGIYNTDEEIYGMQIGLLNEVQECYGTQVGLVNVCHELHGLQIGVFNSATSGPGVQIGLVNTFNDGVFLPILNARF